jgi:hypothetical protein
MRNEPGAQRNEARQQKAISNKRRSRAKIKAEPESLKKTNKAGESTDQKRDNDGKFAR